MPGRNTPRHIVIKLTKIKDKDKILKATREKWQITYEGTLIRLWADFSTETLQARREWHNTFKMMKGKNVQLRILYPAKLSFTFDGEIKAFQTSKFKRIQHHQAKAMAPHSSTLAWKIPWTEEPGRLQSTGLQRVGHSWATSLSLFTFMHWRRKWQPTPVFLPGESQGRGSLVGCRLWGRTESEVT